ncbi:MAG TPA: pitrilysin family protein [Candidatus Aminicenantes bacterium]|nr:pitrilysin family protein [Candidatus Aminicenantes bacterium]
MKRVLFLIPLLSVALLAQPARDPRVLRFPELRFAPAKPQTVELGGGSQLLLLPDHDVPLVRAYMVVESGSILDPQGREGLSSLTVRALKSGGAGGLTPEQVDDRLDGLGTTINVFPDLENSTLSLWSLRENFEVSWQLLTDMVFRPRFDEARLDSEKKGDLEGIRRRWDDPQGTAYTLWPELLYGRSQPEGRRTTSASVSAITRADLVGFHRGSLLGKRVMIAICGDFDPAWAVARVKRDFAAWPAARSAGPEVPPVTLAARPGIYLVDKPAMTQAVLLIGHLGTGRLDPDNAELSVLNFVLGGGGFNSRIMREVRSHRGLAYSAYGTVGAGRDRGAFTCFTQTKTQTAGEATRVIADIVRALTENEVTPGELATAKSYEANSFVFRFESPAALLYQTMTMRLQGFPDDYFDKYLGRIAAVDAAKVKAMARRVLNPDGLVVLVVGPKAQLLEPLKTLGLGEVTELQLPRE